MKILAGWKALLCVTAAEDVRSATFYDEEETLFIILNNNESPSKLYRRGSRQGTFVPDRRHGLEQTCRSGNLIANLEGTPLAIPKDWFG